MNKIDEFLKHLANERNYASKTILNYRLDLEALYNYYPKKGYKDFTYQDLAAYIRQKKCKTKTLARHISTLKSYFKYLVNYQDLEINPATFLSQPKKELNLPDFLTINQLEDLLENINDEIGRAHV